MTILNRFSSNPIIFSKKTFYKKPCQYNEEDIFDQDEEGFD
ncbi:MAG TPA: hypothetical protein VGR54_07395 [Nitrosopumilaceae archaeon]|nr:hypothetical protein [Nitrosopumilaceae archaeon]